MIEVNLKNEAGDSNDLNHRVFNTFLLPQMFVETCPPKSLYDQILFEVTVSRI